MAWYYYNGDKPIPVKVGKGEVESVRPHTMVHLDDVMDSHPETQSLVARRVLIRRGAPKLPKPEREEVVPVAELPKEELATDFTKSFVEPGEEPVEEKEEEAPRRGRRKRKKTRSSKPDPVEEKKDEPAEDKPADDGDESSS